MPDKSSQNRSTTTTPNFFYDHRTEDFPDSAQVSVIFGGLMGFFCNPTEHTCEIGIHPGDNRHTFQIRVFRRLNGGCEDITPPLPASIRDVTVEIPGKPGGVKFFEKGSSSFGRTNSDDPKDFRWLLDLDSDLFYPKNHKKNRPFKPEMRVRQGTFYTRILSNSTFDRVDPADTATNKTDVNKVARYVAAGITLAAGESVSLKINSAEVLSISPMPQVKFEIRLINECLDGGSLCIHEPDHPNDERKRNDFHFSRKVLKVPAGEPVFGLKLKVKGVEPPLDFCTRDMPGAAEVSDEAPCMGAGYGKTPGFP